LRSKSGIQEGGHSTLLEEETASGRERDVLKRKKKKQSPSQKKARKKCNRRRPQGNVRAAQPPEGKIWPGKQNPQRGEGGRVNRQRRREMGRETAWKGVDLGRGVQWGVAKEEVARRKRQGEGKKRGGTERTKVRGKVMTGFGTREGEEQRGGKSIGLAQQKKKKNRRSVGKKGNGFRGAKTCRRRGVVV